MSIVREQKKIPCGGFNYQCQQLAGTVGIKLLHRILKIMTSAGEALSPMLTDTNNRKLIDHEFMGTVEPEEEVTSEEATPEDNLEKDDVTDQDMETSYQLIPVITKAISELMQMVDEDFIVNLLRDLADNSILNYTDDNEKQHDYKTSQGSNFDTHFNVSRFDILFTLAAELIIWNFKEPITRLKTNGAGGKLISTLMTSWEKMTEVTG